MNKKLIILVILCIGTIVSISVKAEDLSKIFNEVYIEKTSNINNNEQKCKTMVNGNCTEYFTSNVNLTPKYHDLNKTDMRYLNKREQQDICTNSFGFWYAVDDYAFSWTALYNQAAKVYIVNIETNSPAHRAGLNIGDEIIKVNGNKVSKFRGTDFDKYIDSLQTVNLEIKGKKPITLTRTNICSKKEVEPYFEQYWTQVCSYNLDNYSNLLNYIGRISNLTTPQFKSDYSEAQLFLNNWLNKKAQFKSGFNLCLANNYNIGDVNNCLDKLVNRTLNSITNEQNLEMQRNAIQAQQQMQQQQINAINNHANALRNQNVHVWGGVDVHHSGTVDVNQNVNGAIYNYNHW